MSEIADKKKRLLKAKIAVALQHELGRVPTTEENRQRLPPGPGSLQGSVGLHFKRQEQKKQGQLAIF